jgi:MSHA biogenesis protein MshL
LDSIISIIIITVLVFLTACSSPEVAAQKVSKYDVKKDSTAQKEIKAFQEYEQKKIDNNVPSMMLPSPYKEMSVFSGEEITLSAQDVKFGTLLHSISNLSGLNLIIDKRVDTDIPVTISVNETNVEDVLDILMQSTGSFYEIQGNILYVKQFMNRSFSIPYVHTVTSFSTELGGDTLSSANAGGSSSGGGSGGSGIKGDFSLKYDNPDSMNGFYEQIEENIKLLMSDDGKYTLNKFSGVLNVYDKKSNVKNIEKLIKDIKSHTHRQVLIEARILEVVLNKSHSLGVSWEAVADNVMKNGDKLLLQQTLALTGGVAGTVTYSSKNFSAIVTALNESGDVDTLSNPRIKVLNGQSAIISSGKLVPFWEKEVQTLQGTGGSASNTQVTYNRRDVLNGLTMGVTPTIMDNGNIMLNVIPITSNIEKVVDYYDENGKVVASAPILNIKEAGTVIYAKDNDLVLIGGLINNTEESNDKSIPLLGDIPFIGTLFTQTVKKNQKRELVILIRLKVIQ